MHKCRWVNCTYSNGETAHIQIRKEHIKAHIIWVKFTYIDGENTHINGERTRIFTTYLKEEKPIFELGKKLANYVLIYNRRNHQAPKYFFVTRAPAKAHSESAYDFPGLTPVPALLSRPFLDACYYSALTTSSASATAPISAPVTGDCSPAPSLRSSCTQ